MREIYNLCAPNNHLCDSLSKTKFNSNVSTIAVQNQSSTLKFWFNLSSFVIIAWLFRTIKAHVTHTFVCCQNVCLHFYQLLVIPNEIGSSSEHIIFSYVAARESFYSIYCVIQRMLIIVSNSYISIIKQ